MKQIENTPEDKKNKSSKEKSINFWKKTL
jgi:hypothetical protein